MIKAQAGVNEDVLDLYGRTKSAVFRVAERKGFDPTGVDAEDIGGIVDDMMVMVLERYKLEGKDAAEKLVGRLEKMEDVAVARFPNAETSGLEEDEVGAVHVGATTRQFNPASTEDVLVETADESISDSNTIDVEVIIEKMARKDVAFIISPEAVSLFEQTVVERVESLRALYQEFADEDGVSIQTFIENDETLSL